MPTATTAPSPERFPGVSRLICTASERYPRYSEADVIELAGGRLLLALGRKDGASDFARGVIVGMFSADGGLTWDDEPHVIQGLFDDVTDLMSVSFSRTPRGAHLFFLGRGPEPKRDTRVYQMISADEGRTWGKPERISARPGYHVVNNARVARTKTGRLIVPAAFVPGEIHALYKQQRVYCLYSEDDGRTWAAGNDLVLDSGPLMEPGVAESAEGSLYMTIRTSTGFVYEARSTDGGVNWEGLRSTHLVAPEAPSTVARDPGSNDLWLFWCDRPKGPWKGRSRQVVAVSKDHGRTWGTPRAIEDDPKHSYGYISVTVVGDQVLLTYYDWENHGQAGFHMTHLRQRVIPLGWFREVEPPVFRKREGAMRRREREDPPEQTRADGMIVFEHQGFFLGLRPTVAAEPAATRWEWAWCHDGESWVKTGWPCAPPGETGTDGSVVVVKKDQVEWGGEMSLNRAQLESWLKSLPQP